MGKTYLFTVGPSTPPAMTIDPGTEIEVTVDGAFDDIEDITEVPTPFTPASAGHPLAPVTGPIAVRGARPGDSVAIDLLAIEPFGEGANAVLRDFGVLKEEFAEPAIVSCPIRDGQAWFGDRVAIPLAPNLGTLSTMPPEGYRPSHAGPYGGDFDQRDVGVGARVHLPVMVDDALIFMADPHAAISDGVSDGSANRCNLPVEVRTWFGSRLYSPGMMRFLVGWPSGVSAGAQNGSFRMMLLSCLISASDNSRSSAASLRTCSTATSCAFISS